MFWILPRYEKKIRPATGVARSPSGIVILSTRCSMARRSGNGILGGSGGGSFLLPPPPSSPPDMPVLDFDLVLIGGSHSGSFSDARITPKGSLDCGFFLPL